MKNLTTEEIPSKLRNPALVAQKREQILKGALTVFKRKGYHKTTVRDIAKAANVSMGSLYDCISTKKDVLYMFYKAFMSTFQKEVLSKTKTIHDPKEKLRLSYRTLLEVYFSLEEEILFGWTEAKNMKTYHLKEVLGFESELITYFKEILDELKSPSDIESGDTYMAANFLVYSSTFGILRRWALKHAYEREEIISYLTNTQLKGLASGAD